MKILPVLKTIIVRSRSVASVTLALLVASAFPLHAAKKPKMVLYAASGTFGVAGTLYTINQTTGAVLTTVGPLEDAAGNPYGMGGMRYNPFDGVLYGSTMSDSPTNPSYLVTIDPATALVTPIGPLGWILTDIAIDPKTGIMYAVSGWNQKFYTVDMDTGAATQSGSTGLGFQNGGGLAVNSKGLIYGIDNFSTYTYNKTTGAATLIGLTLLPNLVKAADFSSSDVLYGWRAAAVPTTRTCASSSQSTLRPDSAYWSGPWAWTISTRWLSSRPRHFSRLGLGRSYRRVSKVRTDPLPHVFLFPHTSPSSTTCMSTSANRSPMPG